MAGAATTSVSETFWRKYVSAVRQILRKSLRKAKYKCTANGFLQELVIMVLICFARNYSYRSFLDESFRHTLWTTTTAWSILNESYKLYKRYSIYWDSQNAEICIEKGYRNRNKPTDRQKLSTREVAQILRYCWTKWYAPCLIPCRKHLVIYFPQLYKRL